MLTMLLLPRRDKPLDLTLRRTARFQAIQVLLRTVSVVGQNRFRALPRLLFDEFHHRHQLLFIIGCFGYRLPDDQQQNRLHRRLRVVTLHNPVGTFHDARLRVGEVILILVLRLDLLGALAFCRCFVPCPLLKHFLGFLDLGQPSLASPQFLRQLVASLAAVLTIFLLVGGLGLLQQLLHFFLQLRLLLLHPAVAHRLVLAGVGLQLRSVQRHPAQLDRAALQRHRQDLLKQFLQRGDVNLTKVRDRPEVRLVARRQHFERDVFLQPLLYPTRTEHPRAVAVYQQLRHQLWIVRRLPPLLLLVHPVDGRQIQLVDDITDEVHQVVFLQPGAEARRQQQVLLRNVGPVALWHKTLCTGSVPFVPQNLWITRTGS